MRTYKTLKKNPYTFLLPEIALTLVHFLDQESAIQSLHSSSVFLLSERKASSANEFLGSCIFEYKLNLSHDLLIAGQRWVVDEGTTFGIRWKLAGSSIFQTFDDGSFPRAIVTNNKGERCAELDIFCVTRSEGSNALNLELVDFRPVNKGLFSKIYH